MHAREIAIAPHASIICGDCPPWITTQSNELYRRLAVPRARVHLQENKARYGQSWGYVDVVVVRFEND